MNLRLIALGVVMMCILAGALVECGKRSAEKDILISDLANQNAAETAWGETQKGIALETDAFASERARITNEAHRARRDLDALAPRPAAPGYVGSVSLVDPDLGRVVLCRIERVRNGAAPDCTASDN